MSKTTKPKYEIGDDVIISFNLSYSEFLDKNFIAEVFQIGKIKNSWTRTDTNEWCYDVEYVGIGHSPVRSENNKPIIMEVVVPESVLIRTSNIIKKVK